MIIDSARPRSDWLQSEHDPFVLDTASVRQHFLGGPVALKKVKIKRPCALEDSLARMLTDKIAAYLVVRQKRTVVARLSRH